MNSSTEVTDCLVHALVDNEIDLNDYAEVESVINHHPVLKQRAKEYAQLNARLMALDEDVVKEPVPPRLLTAAGLIERRAFDPDAVVSFSAYNASAARARKSVAETGNTPAQSRERVPETKPVPAQQSLEQFWPPQSVWRIAAAVMLLVTGTVAGWGLVQYGVIGDNRYSVAQFARDAHTVFAAEGAHAVEVPATQREQLMTWLSKRLQVQVGPPDLLQFKFDLLGGRLLPVLGAHAGQYLYERNDQRLSVYISGKKDAALPMSPECMEQDEAMLAQCAWQDGLLGFYVTAPVAVNELRSIALEIQKQRRER